MTERPPGRPRDPAIDETIRAAARALILEAGPRGFSMEAVAARAGVGKPTLYRRYPNRSVLLVDTVFGRTKDLPMPAGGRLRDDLREAYGWVVAEFAAPEARVALAAVLADGASDPELRRTARAEVLDPEYGRVHALLRAAQERGEVRADADLTLAIDAFVGAALAGATILDRELDDDFAARMVDLVVNGLRPQP